MAEPVKQYPSWAGFALGIPCCAYAGWWIATTKGHFTELQGVIGGAAAGTLAGLVVWALDRRRTPPASGPAGE